MALQTFVGVQASNLLSYSTSSNKDLYRKIKLATSYDYFQYSPLLKKYKIAYESIFSEKFFKKIGISPSVNSTYTLVSNPTILGDITLSVKKVLTLNEKQALGQRNIAGYNFSTNKVKRDGIKCVFSYKSSTNTSISFNVKYEPEEAIRIGLLRKFGTSSQNITYNGKSYRIISESTNLTSSGTYIIIAEYNGVTRYDSNDDIIRVANIEISVSGGVSISTYNSNHLSSEGIYLKTDENRIYFVPIPTDLIGGVISELKFFPYVPIKNYNNNSSVLRRKARKTFSYFRVDGKDILKKVYATDSSIKASYLTLAFNLSDDKLMSDQLVLKLFHKYLNIISPNEQSLFTKFPSGEFSTKIFMYCSRKTISGHIIPTKQYKFSRLDNTEYDGKTSSNFSFIYQESSNSYLQILLTNVTMKYKFNTEEVDVLGDRNNHFILAFPVNMLSDMLENNWEDAYPRLLQCIMYTEQEVEIPWYATDEFIAFVKIVGIAIRIGVFAFSGGSSKFIDIALEEGVNAAVSYLVNIATDLVIDTIIAEFVILVVDVAIQAAVEAYGSSADAILIGSLLSTAINAGIRVGIYSDVWVQSIDVFSNTIHNFVDYDTNMLVDSIKNYEIEVNNRTMLIKDSPLYKDMVNNRGSKVTIYSIENPLEGVSREMDYMDFYRVMDNVLLIKSSSRVI